MTWFIGQSIVMIVLGFLLGLLVGWMLWYRRYRRLDQAEVLRAADPVTVLPHRGGQPAARASEAPAAAPVAAAVEPVAAVVEPEPEAAAALGPAAEAELPADQADDPDTQLEDEAELEDEIAAEAVEVRAEAPEPPTAAQIAAEAEAAQNHPAALMAPVTTDPKGHDRLELIEGIGPKIATALRIAGITTFDQLAGTDEITLRNALADANLRFAPSLTSWPRQARLLADGDHEGHTALTRQLVAGRAPKAD